MPMAAPSGSNTYVPSYDASGAVIEYTRSPSRFRLNQYVKIVPVKKDQGYYLSLDPDEPYRVVSDDDYLWEDGVDAPAGNGERLDFEYKPYRTVRRSFPFNVGMKAVEQADWQVLAAHARKTATKTMTMRTVQVAKLVTTTGNWPTANQVTSLGDWETSSGTDLFIKGTIDLALNGIELATGGIVTDEDSFVLVMNPNKARALSRSPEFRDYLKGSPDALGVLTGTGNPNRRYGLPPTIYGIKIVVENAVRVTTRKGGTQARGYVWGDNAVALLSRPEGLAAEEGSDTVDFSTLAFRFYEEMTVESKADPDNRRYAGRVVEDYSCLLQAPTTGAIILGT